MKDAGLDRLRIALRPLTSLKHLDLDLTAYQKHFTSVNEYLLDRCEIRDSGLDHLKQILQRLVSFQHVSFNFYGY